MSDTRRVRVHLDQANKKERADKVLARSFPELSRAAIQRAFDAGLVRRNDVVLAKNAKVSDGDELEFTQPEVEPLALTPVSLPLEILFEDEHLVAINKQSGLVVHPGAGTRDATLVHALLAHCRGELSGIGGVERPGIVHRLDRETSGIIVVAKNDVAHRGLAEQFAERAIEKEYLALVAGVPELLSGVIREPIGRHPVHRHKMAVVPEKGKPARTDWEVVEKFGTVCTLVRCQIHTGRTHQIRVHMAFARHPLLGDATYGYRPDPRLPMEPPRIMLHAARLRFRHPVTDEELNLEAPLPPDLRDFIEALREDF